MLTEKSSLAVTTRNGFVGLMQIELTRLVMPDMSPTEPPLSHRNAFAKLP